MRTKVQHVAFVATIILAILIIASLLLGFRPSCFEDGVFLLLSPLLPYCFAVSFQNAYGADSQKSK